MASLFDASLALRQVVLPVALMTSPPASFPAGIDTELTAIEQRRAQAYLDRLVEQLRGVGARVSGAAVLGRAVFETILTTADEMGPGMVALATRGRGGTASHVAGKRCGQARAQGRSAGAGYPAKAELRDFAGASAGQPRQFLVDTLQTGAHDGRCLSRSVDMLYSHVRDRVRALRSPLWH